MRMSCWKQSCPERTIMKSFKMLTKKGKEKRNTSKPATVNLKDSIQQKYLSEIKGK